MGSMSPRSSRQSGHLLDSWRGYSRSPAERRLIINADDFGLTEGVNRAILELNAADVLPSATLMATGHAFRDAVARRLPANIARRWLPRCPRGWPTGAASGGASHARARWSISAPVSPRSWSISSAAASPLKKSSTKPSRRFARSSPPASLSPTSTPTSTRTCFPRVLGPLIRAARACNVPAIRNPFEPDWSLRLTEKAPRTRRLQVRTLRLFRDSFCELCALPGSAPRMAPWACSPPGHSTRPMSLRLLHRHARRHLGARLPSRICRCGAATAPEPAS